MQLINEKEINLSYPSCVRKVEMIIIIKVMRDELEKMGSKGEITS